MKKFFKYNVPAAAAALAVIIVLSVFLGIGRTLGTYKGRVERAFTSADNSAASDLKKYKSYAEQLCAIAKANGCDTKKLEEAVNGIDSADPFGGADVALSDVSVLSAVVYAELSAKKELDGQTANTVKSDYYEMTSTVMRLQKNESYNKAAAKYNKAIRSFPANLFSFGKKEAAVFDK